MQDRKQRQLSDGPLGVRMHVWFVVGALLLTCFFLITISHHHATTPSAETAASRHEEAPPQPLHTLRSLRPNPEVFSASAEKEAGATSIPVSAAISNELALARVKLMELRGRYSDEHPEVKGQLRAVESLETSAQRPDETPELAKARADVARLEVYFGPQHPEFRAEQATIQSLEQSAAAGEAPDLAQAKAQLARLRVNYGDQHAEVQSQLKRIAELQR
jgi:capsule polysaccharide export protein KpsE/RkpR